MIKFIKKVLAARKAKQALIRRRQHVEEQHRLIYEGLNERDY